MYNLDGRTIGRSAPPLTFGASVVCRHCGETYFHGLENRKQSHRTRRSSGGGGGGRGGGGGVGSSGGGGAGDDDVWWSKCVHRPLQVELDNDFRVSMLTDRDEALVQSAQLVTDVGYLQSFDHTFYSLTLSLAKSASISFEQYLDAAHRRARLRRGQLSAEELEEEEARKLSEAAATTMPNTAFEATVNGVSTPVHVGLEDVFCRWDFNLQAYDRANHSQEKGVAFCGCAGRLRSQLLDNELRVLQRSTHGRSSGGAGQQPRKPTSQAQVQYLERRMRVAEENFATERELVEELRTGLRPADHADRFVDRIVYQLFKDVTGGHPTDHLSPRGADSLGGGGSEHEGEEEFNADEHLARQWGPMSAAELAIEEEKQRRKAAAAAAAAAAPVEVELTAYGSPSHENRLAMPRSPRRNKGGRYQIGAEVTV